VAAVTAAAAAAIIRVSAGAANEPVLNVRQPQTVGLPNGDPGVTPWNKSIAGAVFIESADI
jgi:hypothetical protein